MSGSENLRKAYYGIAPIISAPPGGPVIQQACQTRAGIYWSGVVYPLPVTGCFRVPSKRSVEPSPGLT